jgi:hypothetical protein
MRIQQTPYGPTDGFGYRDGEDAVGMDESERVLWNQSPSHNERLAILQRRDARRLQEREGRLQKQKEQEQQVWAKSQAGQLLKKLGECFAEYRDYLANDPQLQAKAMQFDTMNQKIFDRMKTNMEKAHNSPRCRFEKANGLFCKAPRMRGKKYCHMHLMLEEARPEKIKLPSLGDANAIQAAIAKGAQAVVDGKLDQKQAGVLGYYLQLALSNVSRVDFEDPHQ